MYDILAFIFFIVGLCQSNFEIMIDVFIVSGLFAIAGSINAIFVSVKKENT